MLLKKEVSDEGKVKLTLNGMDLDYNLSRFLTGTTYEEKEGIFNKYSCNFKFGEFEESFIWGKPFDKTAPVEEIATIIRHRTKVVRQWVASCKATAGEVEVI